MGPGVGASENRSLVLPDLAAQLPGFLVAIGWGRPQDRTEFVIADDVDERRERIRTTFRGDIADASAAEALIGLGVRVADDVVLEIGEAAEHPGLFGP